MKSDLIVTFGSQTRGTAGTTSDFDVAVLSNHALSLKEKADLASKLASKLKISEDKVDLVDLWNAPPLLQFQIAESGKLIYGENDDFIRFRVLAWKRYQDTAKLRRAGEKSLATQYAK